MAVRRKGWIMIIAHNDTIGAKKVDGRIQKKVNSEVFHSGETCH